MFVVLCPCCVCMLEFLHFVLFVFRSICILLHLYLVTFVFWKFVFCSFVFCRVCISYFFAFCHVGILALYFALFVLWNICILSRILRGRAVFLGVE